MLEGAGDDDAGCCDVVAGDDRFRNDADGNDVVGVRERRLLQQRRHSSSGPELLRL